jgi:NAD(P)-dependent dehydrogenase (short-subunit alcohol dehydrogenase family)
MTQTVGSTFPGQGVDVFRLDGYVALVTGGGRGIGAGIARAFVLAGADVALVARTASELEDVAAAIRATGRSASIIPADLTDVSQAQLIVDRTIAEYGHLDILVNNAGGAMPTPYLDTTPQALDESFHFNVSAPFELTKRATPHLLESGRASVINITSRMDSFTARQMVIYGTVKAALSHMTSDFRSTRPLRSTTRCGLPIPPSCSTPSFRCCRPSRKSWRSVREQAKPRRISLPEEHRCSP